MKKANLAVLASGSGSNLAALINAINDGVIENARISVVISNKQDAYALKRAEDAGIPAVFAERSGFNDNETFYRHVLEKLNEFDVDVVLLAGYLRILTNPLLEAYKDRILNIHPSLLPDFGGVGMYGMKVHEEVLKAGVSASGCSVHLVNEHVDGGAIIAQKTVPVLPEDTPEILAARVLKEEHKLYSATVQQFISNIEL